MVETTAVPSSSPAPTRSLVVHFPPQHVGEEVWQARRRRRHHRPLQPARARRAHVAAGPTRLVYEVPEGTRIAYTLEKVLDGAPDPAAAGLARRDRRPARPSTAADIEPPGDVETAIEAPYRLIVSPSARGAFRHESTPEGSRRPRPSSGART